MSEKLEKDAPVFAHACLAHVQGLGHAHMVYKPLVGFLDRIYEILLTHTTIQQYALYGRHRTSDCTNHHAEDTDEAPYCLIGKPAAYGLTARDVCAMLRVNKQTSQEFLDTIKRCVPLHIGYTAKDLWRPCIRDILSPLPKETAKFGTRSPAMSLMVIECLLEPSFSGEAPETFQENVLQSEAFKELMKRLSECAESSNILLRCSLQMTGNDWILHDDFYAVLLMFVVWQI